MWEEFLVAGGKNVDARAALEQGERIDWHAAQSCIAVE